MRRTFHRILVILLATLMLALLPLQALASTEQPTIAPTQAAFEHAVQVLASHVQRQKEGTFSLSLSRLERMRLGVDVNVLRAIEQGMSQVNQLITDGLLQSDEKLNVFPAREEAGMDVVNIMENENAVRCYWWGFRLGLSSAVVNRIQAVLTAGGGVAAVAAVLVNAIPCIGQVLSSVLWAITGVIAAEIGWLMWLNANGRGVYLYFNWLGGLLWGNSQ